MVKKKRNVICVKGEKKMSKMSWISYLCESGNKKQLVEEIGEELANQFLHAHNQMRENRDNPVYDKLNKIHDEMQRNFKNE